MFNPQKSYRHSAPRVQAVACVVHDDLPILAAKIQKSLESSTLLEEKLKIIAQEFVGRDICTSFMKAK